MAVLLSKNIDEPTVFMGVDYLIKDIPKFKRTLEIASELALEDKIITIGIVPRSPETRFGYIRPGDELF